MNRSKHTRVASFKALPQPLTKMNSFVQRFAGNGSSSLMQRQAMNDDEDTHHSDAMWGSAAGFGSLAHGVPDFVVPAVADVSTRISIECI